MGTGESLWSESLIISTHIIDWWRRPSPALNVCQTATSLHVFSLRLPSVGFRLCILRTPLFLHAALASPRTAPPLLTIFIFYSFHNARFSIMATSPLQSSPSLSSNAHFSTYYTNGHLPARPRPSDVSSVFRPDKAYPASIASTPEVQINGKPNGKPRQSRPSTSSGSTHTHDDTAWGSHFWVTLVDPQASCLYWSNIYGFNSGLLCSTRPRFLFSHARRRDKSHGTLQLGTLCTYLCRHFLDTFLMGTLPCRLPPSENGEWWEIGDESRGGIPYYYHTKTGETVWEKPNGFVIPLTVLQVRSLV